MIYLMIALLASPQPDFHALRRPVAAVPYMNLLTGGTDSHDYDAIHYTIFVEVFPETQELDCESMARITSNTPGLTEVRFDFLQMEIDNVWDTTGPLSYVQSSDSVNVTLSSPLDPGDTTDVWFSYSGTPWNEGTGGFGGFWFHPLASFHMGVGVYTDPPSMGRVIFPCWDHPSDKASIEFYITCPDTCYAVANGIQAWKKDLRDGRALFHWVQPQDQPTYCAAFAVSDYIVLVDSTYSWIQYYIYPDDVEDALVSFQNVDLMMDRFESLFRPYPWMTKFSYVQTPSNGDMEHVTEVYHMAGAVNGYNNFDWLLAHEMGHQWWGDCVTETEWTDVWLSEGFATYCEALWMEYYGPDAYDEYMVDDIMIPYLNSGEMFPLSNPTSPSEMWSYTTYEKGASVLHMLRHIMGDSSFFVCLQGYFDHHSFGPTNTDHFRDHVEAEYGDIDWFFDTWVHDWGYPVYDLQYSWVQSGSDWDVTVDLEQVQTIGPVFTMPLEFSIVGSSADSLVVMWNDQQTQSEVFTVPFEPIAVEFDPGHYVLSLHLTGMEFDPQQPVVGTLHFSPNPVLSVTALSWEGTEGEDLTVRMFDLSGRMNTGTYRSGKGRWT